MTYGVGSPEWLAERRSYLGASEMAAALGLSPWDDPISVWERKTGRATEKPESFRMKLGTLIEPIIGKLFEDDLGGLVEPGKGFRPVKLVRWTGPVRHVAAPFLASNPDFRIRGGHPRRTGRGLVQAKLRLDEPFGEIDDGEGLGIPLHYRLQGLGELMTTGYDYVYFAALNPREGLKAYPLDRRLGENEAAITDLYADTREWWETYVIPDRVPPPSAQSQAALLRRYPEAVMQVGKVASAEQEAVLLRFMDRKLQARALDEEIDQAKAEIKAMIGDAAWIEGAGKRFSWSRFDVTKVDYKEIAASLRGIIIDAIAMTDPEAPGIPMRSGEGFVKVTKEHLDLVESLFTRTERQDRLNVGEIK